VLPSLNTSLYALLLALVLPQIVASSRVALMCAAAVATSVIVTVLAGSTPAVLASAAVGFVVLNLTRRYGRPAAPTVRATPAGSAAPTTPDSSGAPTSSSASGAPDSFTREADSETGVHP
jgi:hypothetical protein